MAIVLGNRIGNQNWNPTGQDEMKRVYYMTYIYIYIYIHNVKIPSDKKWGVSEQRQNQKTCSWDRLKGAEPYWYNAMGKA